MSQCFRLGALPDCGSWASRLISNYQHMARTHSNPYSFTPFRALSRSNTHTHMRTFIMIRSTATVISWEKVLFSTEKAKLHSGASARMRTFCAAAFESNYHNYQLIKKAEKCSIDGFDYHELFGVLGWKKGDQPWQRKPIRRKWSEESPLKNREGISFGPFCVAEDL